VPGAEAEFDTAFGAIALGEDAFGEMARDTDEVAIGEGLVAGGKLVGPVDAVSSEVPFRWLSPVKTDEEFGATRPAVEVGSVMAGEVGAKLRASGMAIACDFLSVGIFTSESAEIVFERRSSEAPGAESGRWPEAGVGV
jgi:hypothetical protein